MHERTLAGLLAALLVLLPLPIAYGAAFTVPEMYYEQGISLGNLKIGIAETQRIVPTPFGSSLAPGRQVTFFVGPKSLVLPCSLFDLGIYTSAGFLGLGTMLVVLSRRSRKVRCP